MTLEQELLINQYGQNLVPIETLVEDYNKILEPDDRKMYLNHLVSLIIQSKSEDSDISRAIENSHLRETFTPCVLLKKGGTKYHNLRKIIELPDYELEKALVLFLNLFKIGYNRRFQKEKNNPDKWWYWDLSDENKLDSIKRRTLSENKRGSM
ncbi:DUF5958 family protein [Bacteroides faecium]|uniref:Uncharacterized protein n=1 Tax=Bacteroides faecium TaxID=2715212 RepID=A0A6H0KRJ9_9BACE|nr:DUF5958 family protein [Bacteroides faecium]QIU95661.1 hypothetical protein BacF7301_16555 [Bacteroides faecium]